MSAWPRVKLGDVSKMMRGKAVTKKSITPGNIPVMLGGREPAYYCNEANHSGPCFIVSRSGASAGYVSYWDEPIFVTDGFLFEADSKSDTQFLYYSLKAQQQSLIMSQNGTGIPHVRGEDLKKIELLFPAESERKRIAAILSDYDSAIANARKQIELLEEAAMRLYREWFVVNADPKWEKVRLGELIERTISGDWGAESSKGKQTEKVVCVRGKDLPALTRREVLNPVFRYVTNAHAIDRSVTVGDLIVEMSGGSPSQSTGRATSISRKMLERFKCKMLCTNFCKVVRPKQGFEYVLALHWKQLYDRNVMFGYELGTTGIKNFQLDRFMNEERIVAVDNEMLSRFNRICQSLFNAMDRIGNKIVVLSEARDRLLPKLMSGKVTV